jgi:hypothetical protein
MSQVALHRPAPSERTDRARRRLVARRGHAGQAGETPQEFAASLVERPRRAGRSTRHKRHPDPCAR